MKFYQVILIKKYQKDLENLLFLQTNLICLNNNDYNNSKRSLFGSSDLTQSQPIM